MSHRLTMTALVTQKSQNSTFFMVTDYCLNVRRMSSRLMTNMAGKTEAARMPLWMPFSAERVANPTSEGPSVPPMSPPRARRANKSLQPCC